MARDIFSEPFDLQAWTNAVFGADKPLTEPSPGWEAPWGDGARVLVPEEVIPTTTPDIARVVTATVVDFGPSIEQ